MEKAEKIKNEKEPGFFQKFIYWFLIPLLFALFLSVVIASAMGINVFEKTQEISKKIPFVSDMISGGEKEDLESYERKIVDLEAEIHDKDAKVTELKGQIETADKERDRLLAEQEQLEAQIEELRAMRDENKRAFKDIVSTYETMAPKSAAPIILKMKEDDAVKILSNISTDKLAKIMEKMPPENAAKYSEMLSAKSD